VNPMTSEIVDPTLELGLKLGSGFFWTLAYILIIRRGWKDKSYGMPVVALGANLAWEYLFSWILPHRSPQLEVNRIWLLFDLGILWQVLRYGSNEQQHPWLRRNFYLLLACAMVGGFLAVNGITREFGDFDDVDPVLLDAPFQKRHARAEPLDRHREDGGYDPSLGPFLPEISRLRVVAVSVRRDIPGRSCLYRDAARADPLPRREPLEEILAERQSGG
jgi:hypothetical protein